MRIAVIAANGRLGKAFVEEALHSGHTVRAGVRRKDSLAAHPNLEVVKCDATQPNDVLSLLQGQDVIVSAIGHVKGSSVNVQTAATRSIVAAMNKLNIKRFVDVTGTGVRFAGDQISVMDRILNAGISIIDHNRVQDGIDHQEVLKNSDLDWTTIRVLKLQNIPTKPFALKLHGPTKLFVGRHEVATAMLQVINEGSFVKQAPIISKA